MQQSKSRGSWSEILLAPLIPKMLGFQRSLFSSIASFGSTKCSRALDTPCDDGVLTFEVGEIEAVPWNCR